MTRGWTESAILLCVAALLFCAGCVQKRTRISTPRPQPAYLHWLEKESMMSQAPALIAQVSQSGRVWLKSGRGSDRDILLKAAPTWAEIRAESALTGFLRKLRQDLPLLAGSGIRGLYLGQLGENLDVWLDETPHASDQNGSFSVNPRLGDSAAFEELVAEAEKAGIELGSDLVPMATGRGPDFILQARNAGGHQGLYAMVPVLQEDWKILPPASGEWDCAALDEEAVARAAGAGLIPERMRRDGYAWSNAGGWAATGPVQGMDGQPRRWLYRFDGDIRRPVMLWQDPSNAARIIFSAAIIQKTGLERQTLAGLRLEPAMGLEPDDSARKDSLQPGLEAVNALAAQIHRYGGWALFADPLPPWGMEKILKGPCDFCLDGISPLLARRALLSGDCRPLAALYRHWQKNKLPLHRLARGLDSSNVDAALLAGLPAEMRPAKNPDQGAWPPAAKAEACFRFMRNARLGLPGLAFLGAEGPADNGPDWQEFADLIKARSQCQLALGNLIFVENQGEALLALASRLPTGDIWLLACNFGEGKATLKLELPESARQAADAASGQSLAENLDGQGQKFSLELDGLQARNVLFKMS